MPLIYNLLRFSTSVRYLATDFVTLDASGSLPNAQQTAWSQNYVIQLPSKPVSGGLLLTT